MPKRRIVDIEAEYENKLAAKNEEIDSLKNSLEVKDDIYCHLERKYLTLRKFLTTEQKKQIAELGRSFTIEMNDDE